MMGMASMWVVTMCLVDAVSMVDVFGATDRIPNL